MFIDSSKMLTIELFFQYLLKQPDSVQSKYTSAFAPELQERKTKWRVKIRSCLLCFIIFFHEIGRNSLKA